MCHVEFSMFGRVKSGTINASQLFLQGSMAHVFSIFKLRIHACNKDKITTFYAENIWHLCCQILFHTAITISKTNVGSSSKSLNPNPANTLRPRNSFCFLLVSSHFFYPNFKRPIHSQKWILKQHVRVPLNILKQNTKITCQCTNPFHHLVRATPKTTRKPFQGHGRFCWPRPPWPPQRSAARPRRRGLSQPPDAAPCCLGRRGCDAEGGRLRLLSRNKA